MDFALKFNDNAEADIVVTNGVPEFDDGFETAIYISLFTDARAGDDEELPDNSGDKRGWWANALEEPAFRLGSKLWMLSRSKTVNEVLQRAITYATEALQWMKRDGVVDDIKVDAIRAPGNNMLITARVYKGDQVTTHRFNYNWIAQIANPVHKRGL